MIPRLHVVTDDAVLARPDFPEQAGRVMEAGGNELALHVRGPRTSGARVFSVAAAIAPHARAAGSSILVNDRVDVCVALDLSGVHLGERSLPVDVARRLVGAERLVGASVHTTADAQRAGQASADFLMAGSVFDTVSHPGREPLGLTGFSAIEATATVPVVAIGGVTVERTGEIRSAGAYGVAVLSGVWAAANPARAVEAYLVVIGAA